MPSRIMSLLPCERETLADLRKRQAEMIGAVAHGKPYNGITLHRDDPEVQLVLKALHEAIGRRLEASRGQRAEPERRKARPERRKTGKTARDKAKESYKPADVRKKEKSERDQEIRRQAQGMKGKK